MEFTIRRETIRTEETACRSDGAAVTVTRTVTEAVRTVETARISYRQDWPAYNAAQTNEARRFPELLHGLCQGIVQPPQGKGRPRLPLADVVFCAVIKVYSTVSGRRAVGDLSGCHAKGFHRQGPALQQHVQLSRKPGAHADPEGADRGERDAAQGGGEPVRR